MGKGRQGYGSARPNLQRKLTRRDEQRAMVSRSRQRQERQERQERQKEPPWWARPRRPGDRA